MGRCISWWPPHHHGESHDTKKLLSRETSRVPPQANILPLRQLDFNFSGYTSWGVINLTSFPISQSPSPLQAALTGAIDLLTLSCQTWHIAVRSHEQNTANNCFELSRAESPTSPVWRWPLLGDELTCVLGGEGRVTFTDPCCSSVIETQFVSRDVNTWTVEPPPACPEVDPARSSSHVPWAPHGPGPELSLPTPQWWPVSVEDNLWRQSVPHTAPEDYIHLISGYSIMYFFSPSNYQHSLWMLNFYNF